MGVFDEQPMPEILATRWGSIDSSKQAWMIAALIVLVIRTRKPFFKSRVGLHLLVATLLFVAATLAGAQLPLVVINPAQVRHFAQAIGQRAKSDPIDAAVIARFVEAVKPALRPVPDQQARLLAELAARRRQIIEMIVAERQREQRVEVRVTEFDGTDEVVLQEAAA